MIFYSWPQTGKKINKRKEDGKMQSEKIEELAKALAKAQSEMMGAKKDSESRPFKDNRVVINYADLASVWSSIRDPFTKNGLSFIQGTEQTEVANKILVVSTMLHTSGQWHRSELLINNAADMKILGASLSYARRYLLSAQAGVYQIDLDGLEEGEDDKEEADDNSNGNGSPQKILTEEEKKKLADGVPRKNQADVPLGKVPPMRRDNFVTPEQATSYRKESIRLKIATKTMKAELKKHGISMPDKIPADQFDALFKELELFSSESKNGVTV